MPRKTVKNGKPSTNTTQFREKANIIPPHGAVCSYAVGAFLFHVKHYIKTAEDNDLVRIFAKTIKGARSGSKTRKVGRGRGQSKKRQQKAAIGQ